MARGYPRGSVRGGVEVGSGGVARGPGAAGGDANETCMGLGGVVGLPQLGEWLEGVGLLSHAGL